MHPLAASPSILAVLLLLGSACVDAGPDQTVTSPDDTALLQGRVHGLGPHPEILWSTTRVPEGGAAHIHDARRLRTKATLTGAGLYEFEILATNRQTGESRRDRTAVTLIAADAPPCAHLAAAPLQGEAPRTIDFDASGSSDPEGTALVFIFDFGDGTAPVQTTEPVVSHRFSEPGTFIAHLVVQDAAGSTGEAEQTIVLAPSPLRNGDFEAGSSSPTDWTSGAYADGAAFLWSEGLGPDGTRAAGVRVEAGAENDAWWQQAVTLTPDTPYTFSGFVRGAEIAGGGTGANLCVLGGFDSTGSEGSTGTFDWRPVSMTFVSGESGTADVGARLGFYGSIVSGAVWFDNLTLSADDFAPTLEGAHTRLALERADLAAITRPELARWLSHLDEAWVAYAELVGDAPLDGAPIGVLSVRQYPGGLAVSGLPLPWSIRWQQRYVAEQIERTSALDDWSFALLHEQSHLFDLDGRWLWNAEFWASFKMVYVLETRSAQVVESGTLYVGAEIADLYLPYFEAASITGDYTWAALLYRFILVERSIGWSAFQDAFGTLRALPDADVPVTGAEKLDAFLDALSLGAGHDVRALFAPAELAFMYDNI